MKVNKLFITKILLAGLTFASISGPAISDEVDPICVANCIYEEKCSYGAQGCILWCFDQCTKTPTSPKPSKPIKPLDRPFNGPIEPDSGN